MISIQRTALAAGLLALSGGIAAAAPATVSTDLNLRAGPGTQYGVVALLPVGSTVDTGGCGNGWCQVNFGGYSGYVSARYLDVGGAVYAEPAPVYVDQPYYGSPYYGSNGIYGRGYYGGRYRGGWHHRPHVGHHRGSYRRR